MKAVPPIDSLYYEKVLIKEATLVSKAREGCRICLDTYDPGGNCRYFRWDFTETWKFEIPYTYVENRVCWDSGYSGNDINIRNTIGLSEDRIKGQPVTFVSNNTDRLSRRYSILVNQYSLSEDEYMYWQKIKDVSQDIGGLWDIMPYSIPGNMFCFEDTGEQVFGYFSASVRASKRLYIEDKFRGLINIWADCPDDTLGDDEPLPPRKPGTNEWDIPGLNDGIWIIDGSPLVITYIEGGTDCTLRGTLTKPDFWEDF